MPTSAARRKTLRTIPIFRSLPKHELDVVASNLICREYQAGDILWRVGTHLDFIGVIQSGEITVEYRSNGLGKRVVTLSAGDFLQPRNLSKESRLSSVSAQAATDVTLYILCLDRLLALRSHCSTLDARLTREIQTPVARAPLRKLWLITVIMLVGLLVWRDTSRALSGVIYLASKRAQQMSDYSTALSLLEYATYLNPDASLANSQKGYLRLAMGNGPLAVTALSQALNSNGSNGPALNNLSTIYFSVGQLDPAMAFQTRAVSVDPDNAVTRYNLGLMLMRKGEIAAAIRAFKEASRIEPEWGLPYLQLSSAYLQVRKYVEAEQAARAAIRQDPVQQSAYLSLAIALYEQGKFQEAFVAVENALRFAPNDRVAKFYEALIVRDLGQTEAAILVFQQLLASAEDPQQRERIEVEIELILRRSSTALDNTK
jgi:tetratricopeptide (TPR) repeat protein